MASDSVGSIVKIALLGGAAYWAYTQFIAPAAAAAVAPAAPAAPAAGTTSGATIHPAVLPTFAPVANQSQTASALIDTAGGNLFNVDQWNYFWAQLGGKPFTAEQTSAIETAAGGDNPMSVAAYLAAVGASGYTNVLTGMSGLGNGPRTVSVEFSLSDLARALRSAQVKGTPSVAANGLGAVTIPKPFVVVKGAEGRPVMLLRGGKRVILKGGW